MKNLYDILEGLLDLDDNESNMDAKVSLENHPDWKIVDGWTILMPQKVDYYDRYLNLPNIMIGNNISRGDLWSGDEIGLYKFQGLNSIEISAGHNTNKILKDINCDFCGWLDIDISGKNSDTIDINNFKSPITQIIRVKATGSGEKSVIAYKEYVPLVDLARSYISLHRYAAYDIPWTSTNVKDWNCGNLIVDYTYFLSEELPEDRGNEMNCDGKMFLIDKCQELISNNPKAKNIYLHDNISKYYKLSTKGSGAKRTLKGIINRTKSANGSYHSLIDIAGYQAEGWRITHKELFKNK